MTSEASQTHRLLSAAPLTDVAKFVATYGQAHAPEDDGYQRDPLVVHGRHGKTSAIYNAHAYHTKVPPDAIKPYIEHYTEPGAIVLDPFCGSGMTGVAALQTGRHAILSDLSPAAVHIAYNYCTPVDLAALSREWARIKTEVAEEFEWLYGTTCDRCRGPATIQYTVWSDILACSRCSSDIVLWDVAVVREQASVGFDPPLSGMTGGPGWRPVTTAEAPPKKITAKTPRQAGDVLDEFTCPNCQTILTKAACSYRRTEPVLTCYECDGLCRPRRRERATTAAERERIAEITSSNIPYWVPDTAFDWTREMALRNSKIFRDQGITHVRDFWTPRNLWALASLWHRASAVDDERLAQALRFVVTSTFNRSSKRTRYLFGKGGNSDLAGTLYIGAFTCENNILELAARKWDDVRRGLLEQALFRNTVCHVSECSATGLHVPAASIDYIFTDPPFGSNIFYADCSLLWEAWLGDLTSETDEAVWNKSKTPEEGGKTLDDYRELMERSFSEMYRVLKPGRWATVVFSNSDDRVWHAIQMAAEKAGFAIAGAGTLDKVQRSFKGVRGEKGEEKVVTKDVVMNLLKPVAGARIRAMEGIDDPAAYVRGVLDSYLADLPVTDGSAQPKRTTQALYDHVVTTLLSDSRPTSGIGLTFVQSVAQEAFKQVDGLWYRRGDRIKSERLLTHVADEGSAIGWLERFLGAKPATEAEIIPEFNTASAGAHIKGGLGRLLKENFVQDPVSKRWRVPTTLERDALNDTGALQRRALVHRVATNGSDDMTSDEFLDLAEEALRMELYADAEAIASRIHKPDLGPDAGQRLALLSAVIDAHREETA